MKIIKKTLEKYNRSMYLYFPEGKPRIAYKRCCITILREEDTESSVKELLNNGLSAFAEENNLILSFPNPTKQGWNYRLDENGENDLEVLLAMQEVVGFDRELEPAEAYQGIPSYEMMMSMWHPMNDTKYVIGFGAGASMAYTLAACKPDNLAAIWGIGGTLSDKALDTALWEVMPVYLSDADLRVADYFKKANAVSEEADSDGYYKNKTNPFQCVKVADVKMDITQIATVWKELFSRVRRPNTGAHGDIEPRMVLSEVGFEIFEEDDRLQDGMKHTWFTHVPSSVRRNPDKKVPLMVFMHGGSDNPEEAAEMSKFHELGEREGFITVYPWASNKAAWNMQLNDLEGMNMDDDSYIIALIDYMIANYPVDEGRVYLSGFSNGAGMAQTVGMLHPERIAAICHIDSNWPGNRLGASEFDPEGEKPFSIALEKQKKFPYRMPVWYTYGTREPSYPVYHKCSQQHQYDFWKRYNNIEIKPTPGKEQPHPSGCGVLGDKTEYLNPCVLHPKHQYEVQRFYTRDAGQENLYNFVMMRDKGHDIARMDPELGWYYVKQFKRNPDGTVGRIEETK
jgi:poly(3-hydroxybutyrate) depolymerase